MKKAAMVVRYLLGVVFVVFGLNGFLQFLPMPPMEGTAMMFMSGLMEAGYFFPVLKGTEVIVGALLLANFYVPLALVILAPISLQIFLFHAFVAPQGLLMSLMIVAMHGFLGWAYKNSFKGVLAQKANPSV